MGMRTFFVFLACTWLLGATVAVSHTFYSSLPSPNKTSECHYGTHLEWSARVGSAIFATPRVVDFKHDGRKELLIPTYSQFCEAIDGATGQDVPGFPFMHPGFKSYASPLPVDMDGDGKTEWLVALYSGKIVLLGEDGQALGHLQVPPLAIKKDWQLHKMTVEQAATMRPAPPKYSAEMLEKILRASNISHLTMRPDTLEPSATDPNTHDERRGAEVLDQRAVDDDDDIIVDDDDIFMFDDGPDAKKPEEVRIGPDGALSAEAKASMDLLFHPDLFRSSLMYEKEHDALSAHNLRGEINTKVEDDEVSVDPHLFSTPVLVDIDGNGNLDAVLHVSYFFDMNDYAKGAGRQLPPGINPDDYVATALVCMDLVMGDIRWVRVLHVTSRRDPSPAFAMSSPFVANADEDGSLEIYVTSTTGSITAFDGKGSPLPGWPVWMSPIPASPTGEDVSGDGTLDICVGDVEGHVTCYASNGTVLWTRDVLGGVAEGLTFGDINGDGYVDVVFGTTAGLLYALNGTTGDILPHFPVITRGSIVAPVLLVNILSVQFHRGLHLVVPSHDGNVYIVDGVTGCIEAIDIDEKSSTMVLADDVTGTGTLDLVVTTLNGGVYVFETNAPFAPSKSWTSKPKGLNGHSASENYVGVSITPAYRNPRDVRGDTFQLQISIEDARKTVADRKYAVSVFIGSRIRVFYAVYSASGIYTITARTPLERMHSSATVTMVLPNGQVFVDTVALSFNMYFLETIKYTLLFPFLLVTIALMCVHKRHEVVVPAGDGYTF